MSFSSKNITQTTKRGISFLKGATLFFLGMSLVLFVTKAFEVVPTTQNFVSYFQKMFLTPDGFNTPSSETVILDGVAGDAFFAGIVTGDTVAADTLCLTSDSCITTWPVGGGSASAAGNTTNIQFNGDGTNFSGSDDLVRDSTNGRLGIGVDTPASKLHLLDSNSTTLTLQCLDGDCNNRINFIEDGTTGLYIRTDESDIAENRIRGVTSIPLIFATNDIERMRIAANGDVGIGTNSPSYPLEVMGTGSFSGVCLSGDCRSTWPVGGGDSVWSTGPNQVVFYNGGKVGINTNNPQYILDVNGDINIRSGGGINFSGHSFLLKNPRGGDNIALMNLEGKAVSGTRIDGDFVHISDYRGSGNVATGGNLYVDGNVGIGTYTPGSELEINGDFTLSHGKNRIIKVGGKTTTGNGDSLYVYGGDSFSLPSSAAKVGGSIFLQGGAPAGLHSEFGLGRGSIILNSSGGNVGIGTTSPPGAKLEVNGNIRLTTGGFLQAGNSYSNQIYLKIDGKVGIGTDNPSRELSVNGDVGATAYYYDSDMRLKKDIDFITNPLEKILALNGYLFTWKKNDRRDMGVIAQEVEKIFPEIVSTDDKGYKAVEYGNLVAPLIEAIKELNTKVEQQAQEIAELKTMIQ